MRAGDRVKVTGLTEVDEYNTGLNVGDTGTIISFTQSCRGSESDLFNVRFDDAEKVAAYGRWSGYVGEYCMYRWQLGVIEAEP